MILKATLQYDAVACSWKDITPATRDMLCGWANGIIVMEGYMLDKIPEQFRHKTTVCDVGEDQWCNPFHPELTAKIQGIITTMPLNVEYRPTDPARPAASPAASASS